jgi:N-methylhydantoinase B
VLAASSTRLVSVARARDAYGVVVVDGVVDEAATAAERARRASPVPTGHSLGEERERWDRVFPPALAARLDGYLRTLPVPRRAARRREIVGAVLDLLPEGFPAGGVTAEELDTGAAAFTSAVHSVT